MKNLHVVIDQKFLDGAITLFDSDERVSNDYIILSDTAQSFEYIKSAKVQSIQEEHFLSLCSQYDVLTLHSLPSLPFYLLKQVSKKVKVIWMAWGYDLYEYQYNILIPINIFAPQTFKYIKDNTRLVDRLRLIKKKLNLKYQINSVLSRVDYFSGVFPYEYDEIKKRHKAFNAKPIDYYYGSTNFFIPEKYSTEIIRNKKDILLGNSANPANNHLDALKSMVDAYYSLTESRLIIPLSYGGETPYKETVKKYAKENLPCEVISMEQYLPLQEYLNLISNCKAAIFAHERQQASDNIFLQMLYGAKVYMSETSLAYNYLKSQGYIIHSIQKEMNSIMEDISDEEIINNRKLLSEMYSSSKLIERIHKINDVLLGVES